jgi:hypothetical protein
MEAPVAVVSIDLVDHNAIAMLALRRDRKAHHAMPILIL